MEELKNKEYPDRKFLLGFWLYSYVKCFNKKNYFLSFDQKLSNEKKLGFFPNHQIIFIAPLHPVSVVMSSRNAHLRWDLTTWRQNCTAQRCGLGDVVLNL